DTVATLFDYLPQGVTAVLHRDVPAAVLEFWRDAASRYKLLSHDPEKPLLPPAQIFVPAEEFFTRLQPLERVDVGGPAADAPSGAAEGAGFHTATLPDLAVDRRANDPLSKLKVFVENSGLRIYLAAESPGRRETMSAY